MIENSATRMGGHMAAFAIGAAVGAGIALLYAALLGRRDSSAPGAQGPRHEIPCDGSGGSHERRDP